MRVTGRSGAAAWPRASSAWKLKPMTWAARDQFVLGFRMVGPEHLERGLAGGGGVAVGADEEQGGEAGEDGFQDGGGEVREGHRGGLGVDVRRLFG